MRSGARSGYLPCTPCTLCIAAIGIVGIERVFYATGLDEANATIAAVPAAIRPTTDIAALRRLCAEPLATGGLRSCRVEHPKAMQILGEWAGRKSGA